MKILPDTNVLVRYLTWDDEDQAKEAARAIEDADTIVLSTIVLCELVWVLRRAYGQAETEIAAVLRELVESRNVELDRPAVEAGLEMMAHGGDFADGVIGADAARGRGHLVTFDRDFADRLGEGKAILLGGGRSR